MINFVAIIFADYVCGITPVELVLGIVRSVAAVGHR
jgi:hypothetical protein